MPIVELNDDEIKETRRKIRAARKWLELRYRSSLAGKKLDTVEELGAAHPCLAVEYHSPTSAIAYPYILGFRATIGYPHRLGFLKDGSVVWHVINPVWETEINRWVITPAEIDALCAEFEDRDSEVNKNA